MSRREPDASREAEGDDAPPGKVRLDKWLWAARFFKTRALAAEAVDGGKVDVNGERPKRAKLLQVGDTVQLRQGPLEWKVVVASIASRRGSAQVAQLLYSESDESRTRRERVQEQLRQFPRGFAFGDSKPGKRDRRAIRKLKGDG
jgi:ribosome-associated heat shock protein Hsp15